MHSETVTEWQKENVNFLEEKDEKTKCKMKCVNRNRYIQRGQVGERTCRRGCAVAKTEAVSVPEK